MSSVYCLTSSKVREWRMLFRRLFRLLLRAVVSFMANRHHESVMSPTRPDDECSDEMSSSLRLLGPGVSLWNSHEADIVPRSNDACSSKSTTAAHIRHRSSFSRAVVGFLIRSGLRCKPADMQNRSSVPASVQVRLTFLAVVYFVR